MTTKKIISTGILIIVNIALCSFIFISINFSLLSPQKVHELIQESFIGFALRRLLFAILVTLVTTALALVIWLLIKRSFNFQSPSNKIVFKRQFLLFGLMSLISVAFDLYTANSTQ